MQILTGELEGECWENHLKVAAVLEVSGTEEASPELPVCECRLGNGGFSSPGETVQPEDMLALVTCQPILNIPENTLPRSPQTPLPVPTEVSGICSVMHPAKKGKVCQFLSNG